MDAIEKYSNNYIFKALALIFVIAAIIWRRPDIIYNAQPWAEDGAVWLQDAYNYGFIDSIIRPQVGYYQTIARLIYSFSLIFGLENSPLVANICSIAFRVAFVFFIASRRFSYIDIKIRAAFILYFLFMPNISEGYVNATNVQWYLAVYMVSFLIAERPTTTAWKIHDFLLIIVSALSGPFVVFFALPYLIKRLNENGGLKATLKSLNANDIAFTLCFLIQFLTILESMSHGRPSGPLGASFFLLSDIFYYKLVRGLLLDNSQVAGVRDGITHSVFFIGFVLCSLYMAFRMSWRYSVVLLSVFLVVVVSLARPLMSLDKPQWDFFLLPLGDRYFLLSQLGVFCTILAVISQFGKFSNFLLTAFTIVCLSTYFQSFKISKIQDINYRGQVEAFEKSDASNYEINIFPPGWKINLIRK